MKTFVIDVTRRVTIKIDPAKLTPLMAQFNASITDYGTDDDAFEEHAKHIAALAVENGWDFQPRDFVEGYGIVAEAGIQVTHHNESDLEIVSKAGA